MKSVRKQYGNLDSHPFFGNLHEVSIFEIKLKLISFGIFWIFKKIYKILRGLDWLVTLDWLLCLLLMTEFSSESAIANFQFLKPGKKHAQFHYHYTRIYFVWCGGTVNVIAVNIFGSIHIYVAVKKWQETGVSLLILLFQWEIMRKIVWKIVRTSKAYLEVLGHYVPIMEVCNCKIGKTIIEGIIIYYYYRYYYIIIDIII